MSAKNKKWVLKIECLVTKEVVCEGCTEAQALAEPWDYAIDEREVGQTDWTVQSIQPNE